ncbi:unnamed protein product [Lactuca saligna]|uniref:MULE transposase domain-containing protein n=1 Tax=Lactuca saligna TaxID=75948 RepID=A0AA35YKA4_LACSI|nr:unnamed protein product [Lactuca saligna]
MQTPTVEPNMESPSHIDVAHISPPGMESPIEVESVREPNMEPHIMETFSEALGGSSDSEGSGDSTNSEDSDFIVDKDNFLDDPEVDMHDFYLNIYDNLEWVGDASITTENVAMSDEEMEVINTDVLQSESSSDEGQMSTRRNKIRAAEKAHINDATQVSDPFCILQRFSSSQEAKDRIYLHEIETRRELDIVKNDKNRVRVVCKGTIPDIGILETSRKGGPSQRNINGGPSHTGKKGGQTGEKGGPSKKKSALEVGESIGKRDFLGLDGAFMKGPDPGMILTTVGLDGNNCTYLVAYGLVESENYSSWIWFLKHLGDDLDFTTNSNFRFITDRQKGVLPAIAKLFPCAENRFCIRHIHENMKRKWRGKEFKDCLWKCAATTTVQQFNLAMEELKKLNNDAYEWLEAICNACVSGLAIFSNLIV